MPSIIGFGSLLSEDSARQTVPGLQHYRHVKIPGYKRIFNKVGIVFFEKYGATADRLDISSCATRPDPDVSIWCCYFECSDDEFWPLYEREHRYRWVEVTGETAGGERLTGRMCTEYDDTAYRLNKCVTEAEYEARVGQYYRGFIWRDDILPFPTYLSHCLSAVREAGAEIYDNFLDTSFLADGVTPLRDYIADNPGWEAGADTAYTYRK